MISSSRVNMCHTSAQSIAVARNPIGKFSGREVRDILTNDKTVPNEISDQLTLRLKGYCTVEFFNIALSQGNISYQKMNYKVCYGTTPWALKNNFKYALIDLRYWGILPFGFAYITGLQEAWLNLYPNGHLNLERIKR